MADNVSGAATPSGNGAADQQFIVNAQYIKDLSFENPRAPHSLLQQSEPPEVQLGVDVKAQALGQDVYEVLLSITAKANAGADVVFVTELAYAAVVTLRNTPQELMPMLLLVETPRLLFPFARSIIANATREGGFPPLLIHPIDFADLLRRQQAGAMPTHRDGLSFRLSRRKPERLFHFRQQQRMRRQLLDAGRVRPRRSRRALDDAGRLRTAAGGGEIEAGLPAADQLEIDRGKQLAIELRAVLGAGGEIDAEAPAQRVEAELRAGKAAFGQQQRILDIAGERRAVEALELGGEEFQVELGIVDDQPVAADEFQHLVDNRREGRMLREEFGGEAVHLFRLGRDVALGIDVAMEGAPGRQVIEQLDAGDFDDAVAVRRIETGGFRIENDLAHDVQCAARGVPDASRILPQLAHDALQLRDR